MNHQEAAALTRYVKACCPQQAIDEYTYDAWHDLLGDLSLQECREAVAAVARRQPFVAPAEIRAEVRRVREERIAAVALPAPDHEAAKDPEVYKRAMQEILRRTGNGMPFKAIKGGKRRGAEPSDEFKTARTQEDRDRVMAQTVPCPVEWCPALPGEPCRPGVGGEPLAKWHPTRLQAALAEVCSDQDHNGAEPTSLDAYAAARSARLEHGERG